MATVTYKKVAFNGAVVSINKYVDGIFSSNFGAPKLGDSEIPFLLNPDYRDYKNSGIIAQDPDIEPLLYSEYKDIIPVRLITTTNTVTEIVRYTLAQRTMYVAHLELDIVNMTDAGTPVRHLEATITAKRISNGASLVSTPTVLVDQTDVAGAIPVSAIVSGNDFVIRVTGISGKTIHWHLSGKIKIITNDGR